MSLAVCGRIRGGQSTPGWKWRRVVYQQIHISILYQRFIKQPTQDLAVRLLGNQVIANVYTVGTNLELHRIDLDLP